MRACEGAAASGRSPPDLASAPQRRQAGDGGEVHHHEGERDAREPLARLEDRAGDAPGRRRRPARRARPRRTGCEPAPAPGSTSEQRQQRPRHHQPSDLVRHVLQPHRIDERQQEPRLLRQDLVVARERARLAPRLPRRRRPTPRSKATAAPRTRCGSRPAPRASAPARRRAASRPGSGVQQLPPQRVDRAGRAERRPDAALVAPHPLLVLPVEADAFADARVGVRPARSRARARRWRRRQPGRRNSRRARQSAPGANRWRASAKTRTSPVEAATPALSASGLPPAGTSIRRTAAPKAPSAAPGSSVEPSETTMISRGPG